MLNLSSALFLIAARCNAWTTLHGIAQQSRSFTIHKKYPQARYRHESSLQSNRNSQEKGKIDKGFNLLELASQVVPQGRIVQSAQDSWKFLWKRFMVELAPQDEQGNYQRPSYGFSKTLGSTQHPIEGNQRYAVYLGNPCPWCHRVKLVSNVLGLESQGLLEVTTLEDNPRKASRGGWILTSRLSQAPNLQDLRELYEFLEPGYQGRCTAPLLVDWKTKQIVSNESKNIVRMLPLLLQANWDEETPSLDLCPANLQGKIDETNEWIYRLLNNGVYRCGFATSQVAYDKAAQDVKEGLQKCEAVLKDQTYMCSDSQVTESDLLLLPTMLRFDAVYSPFFGAGGTQLRLEADYPNTFRWMRHCWQSIDGVSSSIDLADACTSYYKQLFPLNPGGIVPPPISAKDLHLED